MNSEKVKEIKKALECCVDSIKYGCEGCPYHKSSSDCQELLIWDMQTYINELESENERLNKSDTSKEESSIEYYNLYKDFKRKNKDLNELCELQRVSIAESFVRENQLKDRIALLEKDNETLRNAKVVYENVDYCYEDFKKAQDRIAELEKVNKDYYDRLNNLQTYIDNHEEIWKSNTKMQLKQFAERLKEKLKDNVDAHNVDNYVECAGFIGETLKEFIENV